MALREILADLHVRVHGAERLHTTDRGVRGLMGSFRAAGGVIAAAGAAITSALAVREVAQFAREMVDLGDEVGKAAQRLGLSASQLQAWRFAADRSGVEANALGGAFQRLQRSAFDASEGSRRQADAFRELGVELRDSNGELVSVDNLMRQVADGMLGVESSTRRAALAQTIMGRQGAQLLTMFGEGEEGIARLMARFDELHGGMSEGFVEDAQEAQDALSDWNVMMVGFKSRLAASFLPTFTRLLQTVTEWTSTVGAALQRSNALEVGLWALAAVLAWVAVLVAVISAPILLAAAAFAFLVLIVDDLITMFQGGDSVIGNFIDSLFGVGASQQVVEALTAAWEAFVAVLERAWEIGGGMWRRLRGGPSQAEVDERGAREQHIRALGRRALGKQESAPDGAERRTRGNLMATLRSPIGVNPMALAGGMGGPGPDGSRRVTIPASAVGGRTDVRQDVRVRMEGARINITGAQDPEAVRRIVESEFTAHESRMARRFVARLPQARPRGEDE